MTRIPYDVRGLPTDDALLRCTELLIGYDRPILPPISLEVRRGSFVVVVGRNGAGKSTWLRTVIGLIAPLGGKVERAPDIRAAYVPQSTALDPILPVETRDLVRWGTLSGWSFLRPFTPAADRARCEEALAAADAAALARVPYGKLSKGQKQRVLFARMLASGADLVLLDEPTAAMDSIAEREAMDRLCKLTRDKGVAVIVVTHYLGIVTEHADAVLYLDKDDEAVVVGPASTVLSHPTFVRKYGAIEHVHAH